MRRPPPPPAFYLGDAFRPHAHPQLSMAGRMAPCFSNPNSKPGSSVPNRRKGKNPDIFVTFPVEPSPRLNFKIAVFTALPPHPIHRGKKAVVSLRQHGAVRCGTRLPRSASSDAHPSSASSTASFSPTCEHSAPAEGGGFYNNKFPSQPPHS